MHTNSAVLFTTGNSLKVTDARWRHMFIFENDQNLFWRFVVPLYWSFGSSFEVSDTTAMSSGHYWFARGSNALFAGFVALPCACWCMNLSEKFWQ